MRLVPAWLAWSALVGLVSARPSAASAPTPGSGLRINEFLAGPARDWDGSGVFSSRDDEWVEVLNAGSVSLDLTGYVLTDGDTIPRYAFSGTLAAGEHLVVYGKTSYDWERANGFPAFGLSLANTSDAVMLWQVTGIDTALVDSVAYRSHEAAADRAVGRLGDTGEWSLFDGLNPYSGTTPPSGTGCNPTPAAPNLCGVTPSRAVSWGRVKAIYR